MSTSEFLDLPEKRMKKQIRDLVSHMQINAQARFDSGNWFMRPATKANVNFPNSNFDLETMEEEPVYGCVTEIPASLFDNLFSIKNISVYKFCSEEKKRGN